MKKLLEVQFEGWTATPRMPFILSGNAICMPTPSYSMLLGLVGCCLGRLVEPNEVRIGFRYSYNDIAQDIETRHRLVNDAGKLKPHAKGTDAYSREFHVKPKLTLWLDRTDWDEYFRYPVGTPTLGRSQDLLKILLKTVRIIDAETVPSAKIEGCMLPFNGLLNSAGQLLQIAEAFRENSSIGSGRVATFSRIFLAIPPSMDEIEKMGVQSISFPNLYKTADDSFLYLHEWNA